MAEDASGDAKRRSSGGAAEGRAGDRPYLISGADDRLVKVWDYQTKACVQTLEGHTHNVSAVCFHPELPIIVSGSEDGSVRIWHATTYRLENTLSYGLERLWALGYARGSNLCAPTSRSPIRSVQCHRPRTMPAAMPRNPMSRRGGAVRVCRSGQRRRAQRAAWQSSGAQRKARSGGNNKWPEGGGPRVVQTLGGRCVTGRMGCVGWAWATTRARC